MSDTPSKIVITGIGSVCPLGIGSSSLTAAWENGHSVAVRNDRAGADLSQIPFIAPIRDFEPKKYVKPRKSIKLMSPTITTAVAAAALAVEDAGLDPTAIDVARLGVVCGSEMLYGDPAEITGLYGQAVQAGVAPSCEALSDFGEQLGSIFPLWLLKYLPNMASCHIGIAQGALAHNNSVVQGYASCLLAIAEAMTVIERGAADVMLTGGTGTMLSESWTCNLPAELFAKFDDPNGASRPFDATRDGIVAGEGTGIFVIERESHAAGRGATALAELAGFGRVFDRLQDAPMNSESNTSVRAIERAIEIAMASAGCTVDDIDHVNANAGSQKIVDAREAQAIRNVLGDTPVTAMKSYFGHLGVGSAAIELAASVWALQSGRVPPTLHYQSPDPECPVNVIAGDHKPLEKPFVIKLSQSNTGQAAAVVLRKC